MGLLYLIKRGPKPEWHKAPFHPVILCDLKKVATWEIGWVGDKTWAWSHEGKARPCGGWLLEFWNGFLVNYGHIVRTFELPDGAKCGFWRDYHDAENGLKSLFAGAVWYSWNKIPGWIAEKGGIYPPDDFTQEHILETIRAEYPAPEIIDRTFEHPPCWPKPIPFEEYLKKQARMDEEREGGE